MKVHPSVPREVLEESDNEGVEEEEEEKEEGEEEEESGEPFPVQNVSKSLVWNTSHPLSISTNHTTK